MEDYAPREVIREVEKTVETKEKKTPESRTQNGLRPSYTRLAMMALRWRARRRPPVSLALGKRSPS